MKWFELLLVLLAFVHLLHAEDALRKFLKVFSAALNTDIENWGGDQVTQEQCAEECLRRPDCDSFEMQDTKCFLSGMASIRSDSKRDYFQRIRDQELISLKKVTIPAGDHLIKMKDVTISECANKCREIPLCKSFVFEEATQKCDLSNVTHHTNDLHPNNSGWDIYIFNPDYKPINCGKPPEMDYASCTDYLANTIYPCETGETYTVVCEEQNTWSQPEKSSCKKSIDCGEPTTMDFASVSKHLDEATYTCATGETYTVVCEENGKWSHPDDVCKKPPDCGNPPLLAFAKVDYKETTFKSMATYTCLMGEKYPVVCSEDGKWTKPSGSCRSPRSCKEFKNCGTPVLDGEYWIYPKILNGERLKVFCAGMSTEQPKEYITMKNENFALYPPLVSFGLFCWKRTVLDHRGQPGKSIYSKVRILPETMVLNISDFEYVNLIDGYGTFKHDFATAEDCLFAADSRCNSHGTFQVNLKGTGLAIDKSVKWKTYGSDSRIQSIQRSDNDQKVRAVCGGTCGGCRPNGPLKVNIFSDDHPNTISAKFCQEL